MNFFKLIPFIIPMWKILKTCISTQMIFHSQYLYCLSNTQQTFLTKKFLIHPSSKPTVIIVIIIMFMVIILTIKSKQSTVNFITINN